MSDLTQGYHVMGVLNVTPDSFYSASRIDGIDTALKTAKKMVAEGAAILDIGGESTRAKRYYGERSEVSSECEADRVLPILSAIRERIDIPLSVDTSDPMIMQEAIKIGVEMINDVRAFTKPGALQAVSGFSGHCVVMHQKLSTDTLSIKAAVTEILQFFEQQKALLVEQGVKDDQIWLDPGFGAWKALDHSLGLVKYLADLSQSKAPILVGFSRKSMIGQVLDEPTENRLYGGLALAALAYRAGACLCRTHDVKATVDVAKMVQAVEARGVDSKQ